MIDMHGIGLVRGQDAQPRMALNKPVTPAVPAWWTIEEDPSRTLLPVGTRIFVDGEEVKGVLGYNAETGYVRAACSGQRGEGHPEGKHIDQDTDRVCEAVIRGEIEVRLP